MNRELYRESQPGITTTEKRQKGSSLLGITLFPLQDYKPKNIYNTSGIHESIQRDGGLRDEEVSGEARRQAQFKKV